MIVFAVLALALALRLAHLSSAMQSPLTYQPGPDEDYYQRFGAAVAAGHGAEAPEFLFMDPGYGYLLGAVFKIAGVNPFAVYLLQALLDTATACAILVAGRQLGRSRAGLLGALLYGVASTAIMFCAALLKETCVAAFTAWWVVGALAVSRSSRKLAWLAFGAFCGIGVALRSTLLLFVLPALVLPRPPDRAVPAAREWVGRTAPLACGLIVSLIPWSVRNFHADGSLSPLPHNSGIVLHQIYNADNPQSAIWIPPFVSYLHPSEIWQGYAAEAARRLGRAMPPQEVDRYWKSEALAFMAQHPGQVAGDVGRKGLAFLAATEVPNNRSSVEERMFSPVLKLLPAPTPWLLAMGLAGLIALAAKDRRWPVVGAPIILAWSAFAAFWAEDRFRFHAAPALALCSGIWIESMIEALRAAPPKPVAKPVLVGAVATVIFALSLQLGTWYPTPAVRWDHVVWGYIKMGRPTQAQLLAARIAAEQPDNASIVEALGYLAAAAQRYDEAAQDYARAVSLRPRSYLAHYNLAKALMALGRRTEAESEAHAAMELNPALELQDLLGQSPASGR